MPRSIANSKVEDFEPKRKNPLGLLNDSNLDEHLKSLKIGDKATPLQLSENEFRVDADLFIGGKLTSHQLETDNQYFDIKMGKTDGTFAYVRFIPEGLSGSRDPFTMYLDGSGGLYNYGDDHIYNYARGTFNWITHDGSGTTTSTALLEAGGKFSLFDGDDTGDKFVIDVGTAGATSLTTTDDDGTAGHLTLVPDGDLVLDPVSTKVIINSTDDLYFDGGGDTYITESASDVLDIQVGGDRVMRISELGGDGNTIDIDDACVGFSQRTPSYSSGTTDVDFRTSNKQFVTFGSGNITSLNCTFPAVSGNFVVLLKQDGTGSRTITNYKVSEFDESLADGSSTIKFSGGSNPTLTTDANHVDIISIYWDADNEIAYGVATLDFQF